MSHITTTQQISNTSRMQSHTDLIDYFDNNCNDNRDLIFYFYFVLYRGLFTLKYPLTINILITTTIPIIINYINILSSPMYTELHSICVITSYSATSSFNLIFSHVTLILIITDAYVRMYRLDPIRYILRYQLAIIAVAPVVTTRTKPPQYSTPSIYNCILTLCFV